MSPADVPTVSRPFFRRAKTCPFSGKGAQKIDWKDTKTLSKFVSERGKMVPRRITSVSQKKQRELARAVKRARFMALLPYMRYETEFVPKPRNNNYDRGPRSDNRPDYKAKKESE